MVIDLFSRTVCLHSLQAVVMDSMMNKTSAHQENLGFYMNSHIFLVYTIVNVTGQYIDILIWSILLEFLSVQVHFFPGFPTVS